MTPRIVQYVPIDSLVCRPQVRESSGYSDEDITGLARSITESGGIHQPLLVRREGDTLVVLDGERRLRAARMAGLATVPVLIEEADLSAAEVTHRQLVLDAQRVGLSPIERARAIQRLMAETAWSAAQVAVNLGVSPANVSKLLALLVLPEDVQGHVAAGRLAMSTAYELAKVSNSAERERLTVEAVSGRLTRAHVVTRTKTLAAASTAAKPRRTAAPRERVVIPLGDGRSVSVSAPSLSVEGIVAWLADLLERLKAASADGRALGDVVSAVSAKRR